MSQTVYLCEEKPKGVHVKFKKLILCSTCCKYIKEENIYTHLKCTTHLKKKCAKEEDDEFNNLLNICD